MKILRITARIIIGLVFIFSGIVKAIDPLGSAYKFHDYFQAFNLEFLNNLSLPLSICLCTAEFISGFSVLTGFRQKTGIWGVFILLVIFTPVTFILAFSPSLPSTVLLKTLLKTVVVLAMQYISPTGRHSARTLSYLAY